MAKGGSDDLATFLPQVDTSTLGEDDIFDIMDALSPVASKWKAIGTALRLKRNKLDEFEIKHKGDVNECLTDTVVEYVRMCYDVKKHGEPTWQKIVRAVEHQAGGNNRAHAIVIAKQHIIASAESKLGSDLISEEEYSHLLMSLGQKLQLQLEVFHSMSVKTDEDKELKSRNVKKVLLDFISITQQSKISVNSVRKLLARLYGSDLLVDNCIYEWALGELSSLEKPSSESSPLEQEESNQKLPPLFNEDTVYHACLSSLATSTCTAANYKDFFNKKFPNHSLEEASLSRSQDRDDIDRYLIARQGKVYYVAFQSELLLSDWIKKFSSFEEGIQIQSERIPLRFFVRQLHDGYRIVFTGFSFGGLLAKAVTARLWLEPVLNVDLLIENITCITFGAPIITISSVAMVIEETPQFGSTVHAFVLDSDPIPRLSMFLDPRCEEVGSEVLLPSVLKSIQNFQGYFTSTLACYLGIIQENGHSKGTDLDAPNALTSVKSLLQKAQPHLLARLPKVTAEGDTLSLVINPSKGLTCKKLHKEELSIHTDFMSLTSIDQLSLKMFSKHNAEEYQRAVLRGYTKQVPQPGSQLKEVANVKPSISSVDFRRYGREVSVTVNGDNLWFCYHIQVARYKSIVKAKETSQHSLQFNYDPENDSRISTDIDQVRVVVSSHFFNPVKQAHAQVSHKVYQFTYRQEQLAKLTPSELIETAYLSALLEQHPHKQLVKFSHRFNVVRDFLKQIVSVVPIESIIHTISSCEDQTIANRCADLVVASQLELPPSLMLEQGIHLALYSQIHCAPHFETREVSYCGVSSIATGKNITNKRAQKDYQKHLENSTDQSHVRSPLEKIIDRECFYARSYVDTHDIVSLQNGVLINLLTGIYPNHPRLNRLIQLSSILVKTKSVLLSLKQISAINGLKVDLVYPGVIGKIPTSELKSPLEILIVGRKHLSELTQQSSSNTAAANSQLKEGQRKLLSQLYNSKMLEIVNDIRSNDLKMCTHLLGGFMEEQIKVPLVKSEFNTAKALGGLLNAAAVGVWAMFSLSLGDMNAVVQSIPSGSLLVQVTEYIKGIFTEKTTTADRNYAGKLQFMVQGMDKTVSCNTHYISYSLERQLIELCKKLNISESTPLEVLVRDWDKLFKEDVLSLVVPTHRSLIASWMKWALMVHNLREELAKYTTVGVVGLVNSGKSLLVSTLFNIEVPVGTTAVKRTTIPFLYNLEGVIDGMDVIDFPGVDDRDDTIPDLCELLLALAQVVIFVVDYRKAHTQSAKKWLEMLEDKSVPVLICLTYADKLYAEHMGKDGSHPEVSHIQQRVAEECSMIKEQLGQVPSHEVQLFSFSQDRDSVLNTAEGREKLKVAGIAPPQAVGDWLAGVFESQLDQDEVAKRLKDYVYSQKK